MVIGRGEVSQKRERERESGETRRLRGFYVA